MASPQQLMEVLSGVTGIPMATIVDHDRKLTKGGLRSKSGRGYSVAQVTARDAAHLLTSILASSYAREAVATVERYASTRYDRARSSAGGFAGTGFADLTALAVHHSFVDALEALIASASSAGAERASGGAPRPQIEIFALTRATRGRIRISGLADGKSVTMEYEPAPEPGAGKSRRVSSAEIDDFEESRRITGRTILAIASLLRTESKND